MGRLHRIKYYKSMIIQLQLTKVIQMFTWLKTDNSIKVSHQNYLDLNTCLHWTIALKHFTLYHYWITVLSNISEKTSSSSRMSCSSCQQVPVHISHQLVSKTICLVCWSNLWTALYTTNVPLISYKHLKNYRA